MIKTLTISNFQSHRKSSVEFADSVTAFVGLNNHGKSAVFRALKKLVRNDPEGVSFIRDGESVCEITLESGDHQVLRRIRSDGASDSNMYIVDGIEFAKFGKSGIPEEVLGAIGVSPVQQFGTDISYDLNFQDQFDLLFLVQGAGLPSIRGKVLGRITGVDIVQRGIQNGAAAERRLGQEAKRCIADMEKLSVQVRRYDWLDGLVQDLGKTGASLLGVELHKRYIDDLDGQYQQLLAILPRAQRLTEAVRILQQVDELDVVGLQKEAERFDNLMLYAEQLQYKRYNCSVLEQFLAIPFDVDVAAVQQLISTVQQVEAAVALQQKIQKLEAEVAAEIPDLSELEYRKNEFVILQELSQSRLKALWALDEKEAALQYAVTLEEVATTDLNDFKNKIGVCPLCERPFETHEEHT